MITASLGRHLGGFVVAFFVAVQAWATGPAGCPWYQPPPTTAGGVPNLWKWSSYSGCELTSSSCPPNGPAGTGTGALCYAAPSGAGSSCKYYFSNGACGGSYNVSVCAYGCPAGYSNAGGTCTLTDVNAVPCPSNTCAAGSYVGHAVFTGTEAGMYAPECYMGCKVDTGNQIKLGAVAAGVFKYGGDWYRTGEPCSSSADRYAEPINADLPPPINAEAPPNSPDFFCITDAKGNDFCTERFKPGCGTVNGKEYCASDFAIDKGECHFFGKAGFICSGNPTTQAPPVNPPAVPNHPPEKTVGLQLPGGGAAGVPGPGAWTGHAQAQGGMYPGNQTLGDDAGGDGSGNPKPGSGSGTVQFDTSGLATESTQAGILGTLGEIKNQLSEFGNGAGGLATAFSGAGSEHDPIDQSAEIQALRTELATKLGAIEAEAGTLFDFNASQAFACPSEWAIEFNGQSFSLCPDWLLESLQPLGAAVLFMAAMLAAFIVLR